MISFLSWYFLITLLGWLTFPLAFRLFPALADRGYTLARAVAMILWGYAFWLLASLGLARNDLGGLLLGLGILAGLSLWSLSNQKDALIQWLKTNGRLVLTTEVLFLLAFAFMAFIRSANPEILGTEKPMELAFINAILRSPTFPPRDPWLSGYAISYYHFGYVMTAMLARMTSVPGTIAFNLMLALVFGLGAVGAYGIVYDLLAAFSARRRKTVTRLPSTHRPILSALLGPLFLLIVSNVEGFLDVLHQRGLFWTFNVDGTATSAFWTWLDIKDLDQPPALPLHWIPDRFWWWWRASRVVQDYDLQHNFQEVIDEFPFFSFLLGDLHPHVLSIPFVLLVIAVALNLFLGGWRGGFNFLGMRLNLSLSGFAFSALVVGGLAFLNVWDVLVGASLVIFAYMLLRVREDGWSWERLEDVFLLGIPLVLCALLLYLPFYIGFSSQAGGLLPNIVNPTRGSALWIMFAPLFVPLFAFLIFILTKVRGRWRTALILTVSFVLGLWAFSWLLGGLVILLKPDLAQQFLSAQGVVNTSALFVAATLRRLSTIGGLLTLMSILALALAFLLNAKFGKSQDEDEVQEEESEPEALPAFNMQPAVFVTLMIVLGALLVIGPDFVYLRDLFGYRINTVFKFYYEAWILWSLAAAFGTAVLLQNLRGIFDWLFRGVFLILLVVSLTYPVLSLPAKTNNFSPANGFTLDDFERVRRENPDEAAAINWLNGASDGVLAEAVGRSYTGYARMSTYTGLPTVLGWPWHEAQWRGSFEPQGSRQSDIQTLYTTPDWNTARLILEKYNVRYVVVGDLEHTTYQTNQTKLEEAKFQQHLKVVFQQGSFTIYEVPPVQ